MSAYRLRSLRQQEECTPAATATPATTATDRTVIGTRVANVAPVAVATPSHSQISRGSQTLERRRRCLERELVAHPEQRVAVHVANAPLRVGPGEPVSVVIAVRCAAGIVSAELHIPRERFDPHLFLRSLAETSESPQ